MVSSGPEEFLALTLWRLRPTPYAGRISFLRVDSRSPQPTSVTPVILSL